MKQYYCLVSGLKELFWDGENKGFDALKIKEEILRQLSAEELRCAELLYTYYDIGNTLNLKLGRSMLNTLGNISAEELEEEIKSPERLPEDIAQILRAYTFVDNPDYEDVEKSGALERDLYSKYYQACENSNCNFLKQWAKIDMDLRNICTAIALRRDDRPIVDMLIGKNNITEALGRSSASDFGLKAEVPYIEQLISSDENTNILERERKIDSIRWSICEDIATFDYFNINTILAYLVKTNIIHRWSRLSPYRGSEIFHNMLNNLSGKERLDIKEE